MLETLPTVPAIKNTIDAIIAKSASGNHASAQIELKVYVAATEPGNMGYPKVLTSLDYLFGQTQDPALRAAAIEAAKRVLPERHHKLLSPYVV